MINAVTMEGSLSVKPVLMESALSGCATEFNLEHSDLTGNAPLVYSWRCRASGELAKDICQRAMKSQVLVVAGKFVQVNVDVDGTVYPVVKLLVQQCAFGRIKVSAP
jgi:hypothetical protein